VLETVKKKKKKKKCVLEVGEVCTRNVIALS